MSSFLGAGAPIFEIRDARGMTDMLVRDNKTRRCAGKIAGEQRRCCDARPWYRRGRQIGANVVFRAIYTQVNAHMQAEAARMGTVKFLSPEEAAKAAVTNEGHDVAAVGIMEIARWKDRIENNKNEEPESRVIPK